MLQASRKVDVGISRRSRRLPIILDKQEREREENNGDILRKS
jgi:hypothetical protein